MATLFDTALFFDRPNMSQARIIMEEQAGLSLRRGVGGAAQQFGDLPNLNWALIPDLEVPLEV
jgi:hypothetical protein